MNRLRRLVAVLGVAAVVLIHAHGLTLAVQSWNARGPDMSCDLVGAPVVVVDACRDSVWVSSWGQQ